MGTVKPSDFNAEPGNDHLENTNTCTQESDKKLVFIKPST